MAQEGPDLTDMNFEEALKALEDVVRRLESGEVPLDESIDLYERGEKLRKHCQARLDAAQARIEKIVAGPTARPRAPSRSTPGRPDVGLDLADDPLTRGFQRVQREVDERFEQLLPVPDDARARLIEAMRHAAIGGGKRLRPLLLTATAEMFGVGARVRGARRLRDRIDPRLFADPRRSAVHGR